MKLRIRGNSIRLRLTRSEVDQYGETSMVGEMVEFALDSPVLRYELTISSKNDLIQASFDEDCLRISVPAWGVENWIGSEQAAWKLYTRSATINS